MIDSPYIARRATASIPVWKLYAFGQEIGIATIFDTDCEGPMASVRYDPIDSEFIATFQAPTIPELLAEVGEYLRKVDNDVEYLDADAEYQAMRAEEAAEWDIDARFRNPEVF